MGRLIDHAGNGRARLMIEALIREYKTRLTDLLLWKSPLRRGFPVFNEWLLFNKWRMVDSL